MSAHLSTEPVQPGKERSAAARALTACVISVIVTGACLTAALLAASKSALALVAGGGAAAAGVIVIAVTAAVYYAESARRSVARAARADREVGRLEREFVELARDTLPQLAQRVRAGADAESALAGLAGQASGPVRSLLASVQGVLADALGEAAVGQRDAAIAAADRATVEAEAETMASTTVPAAISRLRSGESADTVLAELNQPSSRVLAGLLDTMVNEVGAAERRGASAMSACANAAARVQAQTTRMLSELREMEQRHGDDKVFADLMELDHRVSQMGRLADSIALLAGGRSGRRWTKPIPMESVLRGAMGRIDAYQRVRPHSTSTAAVAGYAAEGVMHALAELMDNAAAFSAHGSEVHVYVEDEDAGVVVTIEDSGLGMRKRERTRAEGLVAQPFDLSTLPGTRLGLAVVGRVATRYGLSVNFRPSSRGGTGVVVMIPRALIAQPRAAAGEDFGGYAPAASEPERPAFQETADVARDGDPDQPDDLPVRPRGRTLAAAARPPAAPAAGQPTREARTVGSRFAAFRQAGQSAGTGPNVTAEPAETADPSESTGLSASSGPSPATGSSSIWDASNDN
ncbi:MAG TPA: ATP-binding protein [Trebonia sp.]|jgi:signal transduction histidine kinase|nr:ATP-binding protein [Trebonia sp.]